MNGAAYWDFIFVGWVGGFGVTSTRFGIFRIEILPGRICSDGEGIH